MAMGTINYKEGDIFQLLLERKEAASVADEWTERNIQSDLRIRRAKTRGHIVVETKDPVFASYIVQWHPGCKVNIKKADK